MNHIKTFEQYLAEQDADTLNEESVEEIEQAEDPAEIAKDDIQIGNGTQNTLLSEKE